MKTLLIPIFTVLAFLLNACGMNVIVGSGNLSTETRTASNFEKIILAVPARLVLTQGQNESLEISAEENLMAYIHSKVENGVLSIYVEENINIMPTEEILIRLSAKDISAITISGSGKIISNALNAEELSLQINGSGEFIIDQIDTKQLGANINGSGEMRLDKISAANTRLSIDGSGKYIVAGQSNSVELLVNGSGRIQAQHLESEQAQASINGSGNIAVWASEQLTARITGSGEIAYSGQAQVAKVINGSGSIHAE